MRPPIFVAMTFVAIPLWRGMVLVRTIHTIGLTAIPVRLTRNSVSRTGMAVIALHLHRTPIRMMGKQLRLPAPHPEWPLACRATSYRGFLYAQRLSSPREARWGGFFLAHRPSSNKAPEARLVCARRLRCLGRNRKGRYGSLLCQMAFGAVTTTEVGLTCCRQRSALCRLFFLSAFADILGRMLGQDAGKAGQRSEITLCPCRT